MSIEITPQESEAMLTQALSNIDSPKPPVPPQSESTKVSTAVDSPEPMKRKCELKQVLPVGVIALLASAPHNETVRNVLLAHLKVPVPEELKSYKDIQDWIEFNIEPLVTPLVKGKPAPGRAADLVMVLVEANEREHGSCSYSQDTRGRGSVGISHEDIMEAASNAGDDEEFFNNVNSELHDSVRDNISMDTVDDTTTTSDHEVSDSDGLEIEIKAVGRDALREALRNISPEDYERLFE